MTTRARVGIFGGAFDPPHLGHVELARAAIAHCQLSRLLVIPTGVAWHKAHTPSAATHRVAMSQLAFGSISAAQVDLREVQRHGNTYTIDTLVQLQAQFPGSEFFLILGEDQFAGFQTWKQWQQIRSIARLVVAQRPVMGQGADYCLEMPERFHHLSSTQIRLGLRTHDASAFQHLPSSVAAYIRRHGLYQ